MNVKSLGIALAATGVMALSLAPATFAATAGGTAGFSLTIPSTVILQTLAGNANDTFPAMVVAVSPAGVASGSTALSWTLSSNTVGGAIVTAYIPDLVIPASGGANLKNDIKVTVADGGGAVPITPAGGYVAGKAVGAMPSTSGAAENMFSTAAPGIGQALMTLSLSSPAADGSGTVTGTITMIATSQ